MSLSCLRVGEVEVRGVPSSTQRAVTAERKGDWPAVAGREGSMAGTSASWVGMGTMVARGRTMDSSAASWTRRGARWVGTR